jgi:tetratricopeptide (TPR) repeat protein
MSQERWSREAEHPRRRQLALVGCIIQLRSKRSGRERWRRRLAALAILPIVLTSTNCKKAPDTSSQAHKSPSSRTHTRDILPEAVHLGVTTAEEAVRRGKEAKNANKDAEGIQWFTRAIQLDPNCVEAYEQRGGMLCVSRQWDDALRDLDRAIELNAQNPYTFVYRGTIHRLKSNWDNAIRDYTLSLEMIERGNYMLCFDDEHVDLSTFIERCQRCNARDDIYILRAEAYLKADHNFDKARADLEASRRMSLDVFECLRGQVDAKTSRKMSRYDPNRLREGLTVALRDPNRLHIWGEARRKDTLKKYDALLAEDPTNVQVYRNRGDLHFCAGDINDAIRDWSHVLELMPYDAWTYFWRGFAFLRSSDVGSAEVDFIKATECDPTIWLCHYFAAFGPAVHGRIQEAAARISVCRGLGESVNPDFLDLLPPSWEGYDTLGLKKLQEQLHRLNKLMTDEFAADRRLGFSASDLLFAHGGVQTVARPALDGLSAIERFSRAIELDPCYPAAYCLRGDAYLRLPGQDFPKSRGQTAPEAWEVEKEVARYLDLALQDYGVAIQLCPRRPIFHIRRAIAHILKAQLDYSHKDEHYENAISDCTSAIKLDPSCPEAYNTRANAYYGKYNYEKAVNDLRAMHRLGCYGDSRLALKLFMHRVWK